MAFINPIDIATLRETLASLVPSPEGTVEAALAIVDKAIGQRADKALLERAGDLFARDNIEIDDVAGTSPTDDGCWVQAWVYVPDEESECGECGVEGPFP